MARPRSRYSSSWAFEFWKKDCSRRACDSRVGALAPNESGACAAPAFGAGANGELAASGAGCAYGFSGVELWCGRRPRSSVRVCVVCCVVVSGLGGAGSVGGMGGGGYAVEV